MHRPRDRSPVKWTNRSFIAAGRKKVLKRVIGSPPPARSLPGSSNAGLISPVGPVHPVKNSATSQSAFTPPSGSRVTAYQTPARQGEVIVIDHRDFHF